MDNITTLLVSLSALLLASVTLVNNIFKAKKELEETLPHKIKRQCNIDIEITTRMEEVKERLKADRIQVYDFHNGGHYANGRSALKTSCSYEVVRAGCRGYQTYLQAIPLTCIPQFIKSLLNKNELKINDLQEIKKEMPATYSLKRDQGIRSFYDVILNNKNNEPVGFLAIQYGEIDKVNFTQEEMNEILKLKFFIEENLEKMVSKK